MRGTLTTMIPRECKPVSDRTRTMRELGRSIQAARASRGWSQTVLAQQAGVSRPSVARIEAGEDVSTLTLSKVTEAIELSLDLVPIQEL